MPPAANGGAKAWRFLMASNAEANDWNFELGNGWNLIFFFPNDHNKPGFSDLSPALQSPSTKPI